MNEMMYMLIVSSFGIFVKWEVKPRLPLKKLVFLHYNFIGKGNFIGTQRKKMKDQNLRIPVLNMKSLTYWNGDPLPKNIYYRLKKFIIYFIIYLFFVYSFLQNRVWNFESLWYELCFTGLILKIITGCCGL